MKPTAINKIKLWWHCFTHMHKEVSVETFDEVLGIECGGCNYGDIY